MAESFDVIVIGSGPGGYVAAIRAAQLGMKVACIDKRAAPGGTCLNIGCIPSKALLQSSEKFEEAGHALAVHGIKAGKIEFDLAAMLARKDKVVADNTKGVEFLFRKNKVAFLNGVARLTAKDSVQVGEASLIATKAIIIATGSDSVGLPGIAIDEKTIVTSTGALELSSVPKRLVVVGGGYIGLEMGSVWRRLGAQVTVVEFLDRITPAMDREIGKVLQAALAKQGFVFRLSTKVTAARKTKGGVVLVARRGRRAASPKSCLATWSSLRSGAGPIPTGSASKRWASLATSRAASWSIKALRRACPAFMRSAT